MNLSIKIRFFLCRLNYSHREHNHVNDLERLLFISLSHEEHHNDKKLICTNVVQISLIVCCSNVKFHSHHSIFCHRSCLNLLRIVFTQQFWHVFLMNYESSLSNLINFTPLYSCHFHTLQNTIINNKRAVNAKMLIFLHTHNLHIFYPLHIPYWWEINK